MPHPFFGAKDVCYTVFKKRGNKKLFFGRPAWSLSGSTVTFLFAPLSGFRAFALPGDIAFDPGRVGMRRLRLYLTVAWTCAVDATTTSVARPPVPGWLTAEVELTDGERVKVRRIVEADTGDFTFRKAALHGALGYQAESWPDEWPFSAESFLREDDDDEAFYATPRFLDHIGEGPARALMHYYASEIPAGSSVLDLCAGWASYFPDDFPRRMRRIAGVGIHEDELRVNHQLGEWVQSDLNTEVSLPFADGSFDVVTCAGQLPHVLRPRELFREVNRVLVPGGTFMTALSNKCFPSKATAIWRSQDELGHCLLAAAYFHYAGGYLPAEAFDLTPLETKPGEQSSPIEMSPSELFKADPMADTLAIVQGTKLGRRSLWMGGGAEGVVGRAADSRNDQRNNPRNNLRNDQRNVQRNDPRNSARNDLRNNPRNSPRVAPPIAKAELSATAPIAKMARGATASARDPSAHRQLVHVRGHHGEGMGLSEPMGGLGWEARPLLMAKTPRSTATAEELRLSRAALERLTEMLAELEERRVAEGEECALGEGLDGAADAHPTAQGGASLQDEAADAVAPRDAAENAAESAAGASGRRARKSRRALEDARGVGALNGLGMLLRHPAVDPLRAQRLCCTGSVAAAAAHGGTEAWSEWLSRWREHLDGWWAALPAHTGSRLQNCALFMGGVLASRFDRWLLLNRLGKNGPKPPTTPKRDLAEGSCESLMDSVEMTLPDFPEPPTGLRFWLPPLFPKPSLLPGELGGSYRIELEAQQSAIAEAAPSAGATPLTLSAAAAAYDGGQVAPEASPILVAGAGVMGAAGAALMLAGGVLLLRARRRVASRGRIGLRALCNNGASARKSIGAQISPYSPGVLPSTDMPSPYGGG